VAQLLYKLVVAQAHVLDMACQLVLEQDKVEAPVPDKALVLDMAVVLDKVHDLGNFFNDF